MDGADLALAEIDELAAQLDGYHAFHATRADLLRRVGRDDQAAAAYDLGIALASNPAERAYLTRRRDEVRAARSLADQHDLTPGRETLWRQ